MGHLDIDGNISLAPQADVRTFNQYVDTTPEMIFDIA